MNRIALIISSAERDRQAETVFALKSTECPCELQPERQ